jgi:hypothetical protein
MGENPRRGAGILLDSGSIRRLEVKLAPATRREGEHAKMKDFILGAMMLLATACAAPAATGAGSAVSAKPAAKATDKAVAAADPDTVYVCEKVRPTGSNIPEEVCRTVRRKEEERRQAQDLVTRPRTFNAGNR